MILATKSGWLIPVQLLRETPKAYIVQDVHEKTEHRVEKANTKRKLFDSVDEAIAWQEEDWI